MHIFDQWTAHKVQCAACRYTSRDIFQAVSRWASNA